MRQLTVSYVLAAVIAVLPTVGNAKGCLKGAAVGGVVGHVAGHHAVLGAAAGCVIEHHREKAKSEAARQNTQSGQGAASRGASKPQ